MHMQTTSEQAADDFRQIKFYSFANLPDKH